MSPGLYDGFEGYRSATRDREREAVASWLVVLDTNVLLGLYNYHGATLEDFTKVFTALGDRLFIPHQVMDEFWRNRRTVLSENRGRHREREVVEGAFDDIENALRKWHQRVVDRGGRPPADVLRELKEGRSAVLDHMDAMNASARITQPDTPTHEDHVLTTLADLLDDRVGAAPSDEQRRALLAEAKARAAAKTPPGYMDAGKSDDRAAGDYLVWRQTMEKSKDSQMPVLFITQDQKEDWWADRGTASMRARPELVAELLAFADKDLLMMRAHDLLGYGDVLGVEVSAATVEAAEEASEELEVQPETGVAPLYREFWSLFEGPAKARGWTTGRPPSANWWSLPAGGGGNYYSVSYANFGCRSELYFGHKDREVNLHRYGILESMRGQIQEAFGNDDVVHFDPLPHAVACRVEIRNEDGRSIQERDLWDDTVAWMVDRQERMRAAIDSVGGVPLSLPS